MPTFVPASEDLFFSKNDSSDPRRGEMVRAISAAKDLPSGIVLAGYPDDQGIKLNGGRVGASKGPDAIRRFLYRMTYNSGKPVYDLGNLKISGSLKDRHETARKQVLASLQAKHRWIGLGGGHDYGFADGAGFLDWSRSQKQKPVIINFDAHLDVRKPNPEINSGTPFYRLSEHGTKFDFLQIGIQDQCNSKAHLDWSKAKGHKLIKLDDYWNSKKSLKDYVTKEAGSIFRKKRPCFLSIDIDAFAWPYAMGSSQSWPTGLEPKEVWPCLDMIFDKLDVKVLGVYETSPPLDFDFGTSKLSSLIVDTFIRKSAK